MSDYPMTIRERQAERKRLVDYVMDRARRDITIRGRSMKCGGFDGVTEPRHAGTEDGCKNDGTGCLCECHDPGSV
jgi:hypothetical protein